MFKTIYGSGRYVQVVGGYNTPTYVTPSIGLMSVGEVRYNTQGNFEVYDGYLWTEIQMGHASIQLSPEAEMLLDWAKNKMKEELELKELAEKHPTLKALVEDLENVQEKIKVVQTLVKDEVSVGSV